MSRSSAPSRFLFLLIHASPHDAPATDSPAPSFPGAKAGKGQVRRSAVLIRRALSWALAVQDPADFDTRVYILIPPVKMACV